MKNSILFLLMTFTIRVIQVFRVSKSVIKAEISYYPSSVKNLESKFADITKVKHALMFTNATSAMESALYAVGIGKGDYVGTTGFVIPSSYCSAFCLDAKIVFYDINPKTLNLDIDELKKKSDIKLKVLIVTHFYGNPSDMEVIMDWSKKNNVFVIEDCSHSHGASFKGIPLGSWGHVGVFSLQGAKAVAAGEGAVVVTNDTNLALTMAAYGHQESFKKFGIGDKKTLSSLPLFGYGRKMRAHPLGAVLANVDLQFLSFKNQIYAAWVKDLTKVATKSGVFALPEVSKNGIQAGFCQGIPIIFSNKLMADEFFNLSKSNNISCFRRDYQDSIKYYSLSNTVSLEDQLSISFNYFDLVVFIPFYQFILPFRWNKLLKILKIIKLSNPNSHLKNSGKYKNVS